MTKFDSLRTDLLHSHLQARDEEKIEVNQRHLIDKILARYSAEYTIYREVLQNANDANAMSVEIIFEEDEALKKFDASAATITALTLRNNGRPFDANDWSRLKKIAEGNPDEQKIGFFGVGFYSLFSICDEPFVISGRKCLAFYWKGDQLYARHGEMPTDDSWTSIYLKLREPIHRPHLDSFAHFLSKSILFTQCLEGVAVTSNESLLFKICKKRSGKNDMPISPNSVFKTLTSSMFTIRNVQMQAVQFELDKKYTSEEVKEERSLLASIWSLAKNAVKDKKQIAREEALRAPGTFSLFLHVIECEIKIVTNSQFTAAMERITKKKHASSSKIFLVYRTFDELSASSSLADDHPVLSGVLPDPESGGRVFIGFETHQGTGCALHVSAPYIPTVERESLDFVDKSLSHWNEELTRVCGKLVRLIYDVEMQNLSRICPTTSGDYLKRSKFIIDSFGIGPSGPSPAVSHLIRQEFYNSTIKPLLLPSSTGVVSVTDLRSVPSSVIFFANGIPTMEGIDPTSRFVTNLTSIYNIPPCNVMEVIACLKGKCLSLEQMLPCMEWIISLHHTNQLTSKVFYAITSTLMVPVADGKLYKLLANVTHYVGEMLLYEKDIPLPEYCLAGKISEHIAGYDLDSVFNLKPLNLVEWVMFLTKNRKDLLTDKVSAEKIAVLLCSKFQKILENDQASIASALSNVACIPTRHGMCRPVDAYLEEVNIFGDVATVTFSNRRNITDSFLIALGVQSHIDVSVIFAKLDGMEWDHRQLIKYMTRIEQQLSKEELQKLEEAHIFPAIGVEGKKYVIRELYIEDPVVKLLGLPMLEWKDGQAPSRHSATTSFMIRLGLKTIIPWDIVLKGVREASHHNRTILFRYFIDHRESEYKHLYRGKEVSFEFLPLKDSDDLGRPSDCFADEALVILGFKVIHPELKPFSRIFDVEQRPNTALILNKLVEKKWPLDKAGELFAYLSTIAHEISPSQLKELSRYEFVPVEKEWFRPCDLFFSKGRFDFGEKAFRIIDYGSQGRNFLRLCGVKDEPMPNDIARLLIEDPVSFLLRMGPETYLDILRFLSIQYNQIDGSLVRSLASNPILLGVDYSQNNDEIAEAKYVLATAKDLFIIDDTISQQIFSCLAVPNDTSLEQFYKKLGCRILSKCVATNWRFSGTPNTRDTVAAELQQTIRNRAPLLTFEQPSTSKHHAQAQKRLANIEVARVDSILISRKFEGRQHDQQTSAYLQSPNMLLVTKSYDFFDVASVLTSLIYEESSRLPDVLLLSTLLSLPLASLRAKGFPVDRVLVSRVTVKDTQPVPDIQKLEPMRPTEKVTNAPISKELIPEEPTDTPPQSAITPPPSSRRPSSILGAIKNAFRDVKRRPSIQDKPPTSDSINDEGLRSSLEESIRNLRVHDERESIDDPEQVSLPPSVPAWSEQEADSYCEIIPGHSLFHAGVVNGLPLYCSRHVFTQETAIHAMNEHSGDIHRFTDLLLRLGRVFAIPPPAIHVFYDPNTLAIAFNRSRTLFFNFAYYYRQVKSGQDQYTIAASWFMTVCHELAHNFIGPHDQRHEFYMSSFAEQYLFTFFNSCK